MDYGRLIKDAWETTWTHRWLWVLGVFAGGAVGGASFGSGGGGTGGGTWRADDADVQRYAPQARAFAEQAGAWAAANAGLLVGLGVLAAALAVAALIMAPIAQGGMARATEDLAEGRPTSLGLAFRAGVHYFWRFVGLWLLLAAAAILAAAVVGAVVAAFFVGAAAAGEGGTNVALVVVGVLVGIPLLLAAIAAGVVASIVVAFAQRAITYDDLGPVAALQAGWALFRAHVGDSLLVWLLNLALGLGAALVVGAAVAAVAAVLGAVGVAVWVAAGLGGVTLAYAALAALALLAGALVLAGASNAFFWSYWTLAYVRLLGRAGRAPVAA